MVVTYAILAALAASGVLLAVHGARRTERPDRAPTTRTRRPAPLRLAGAASAGLGVALVTGWPVGAAGAAALVWWLPAIWGAQRGETRAAGRVEAVATWAEMLRDTLSAAAGLEQTILATADLAPPVIRTEVGALADALRAGARMPDALAALAEALADPTADLVIASLLHAATHQSAHLGERLGVLAGAAREQALARERIAAERARTRSAVRIIVALTVTMLVVMTAFNAGFLTPYTTPAGQLVLAGVAAVFATAFAWLHRLSRLRTPPRVLTGLAGGAGNTP